MHWSPINSNDFEFSKSVEFRAEKTMNLKLQIHWDLSATNALQFFKIIGFHYVTSEI